jgi:hypothetical protein
MSTDASFGGSPEPEPPDPDAPPVPPVAIDVPPEPTVDPPEPVTPPPPPLPLELLVVDPELVPLEVPEFVVVLVAPELV